MNFSDLCKAFYLGQGKIGLKECRGQKAIAELLIHGLVSKDLDEMSESTYINWFNNNPGPDENTWKALADAFNEENYAKELAKVFNKKNISECARRLGVYVPQDATVDGLKLSYAIARQMQCFIDHDGEADNVIAELYGAVDKNLRFATYIENATERYDVMKLIGGDEVQLEKYFICNNLGDAQRINGDRTNFHGTLIEDATVEKIRNIHADIQFDNRKCLLIGSGGSGKTLMLQHLFLLAANRYSRHESDLLPVFLELRNFKNSDDIMSFLIESVTQMGQEFDLETADKLIRQNKCVLLMDGLDEIDPSDIGVFQKSLKIFANKYKKVQIILTSRLCDSLNGIDRFTKFYVWPFNRSQAETLVQKILEAEGKEEVKSYVMEYLTHGFIGSDGVFASHPMLLTFVCRNYGSFEKFHNDHATFYLEAYRALLSGHDKNKKPYERIFHGVDNADQFTTVFQEFCAKTFQDGIFEFDSESFHRYYEQLESYKRFENPHKMTEEHFLQDACSTACMLYEHDLDIRYIDPGFQEFLFAEYYSVAGKEETVDLGRKLQSKRATDFNKLDAFYMLYQKAQPKINQYVFLPKLERIFKGAPSDKDAFIKFLCECFEKVEVAVVNVELVTAMKIRNGINNYRYRPVENEPMSVTTTIMLKECTLPLTCSFVGYERAIIDQTPDGKMLGAVLTNDPQTGEKVAVLVVNNWEKQTDKLKKIKHIFQEEYQQAIDSILEFSEENTITAPLGYQYSIDPYDIEEAPERYEALISSMMEEGNTFYSSFLELKNFYKQLRREQRRAGNM